MAPAARSGQPGQAERVTGWAHAMHGVHGVRLARLPRLMRGVLATGSALWLSCAVAAPGAPVSEEEAAPSEVRTQAQDDETGPPAGLPGRAESAQVVAPRRRREHEPAALRAPMTGTVQAPRSAWAGADAGPALEAAADGAQPPVPLWAVDGDAPATLDAASSRAVALGSGAQVTQGAQAAALGAQAQARGSRAVALGASARARGDAAQALGAQAQVAGDYTVAVGPSARAGRLGTAADGTQDRKANYAVAMGFNAGVEASGAVAIGSEAQADASARHGVSVGAGSRTQAAGAVALGAGAQATRAQTVSIGNTRQQRQLVNLAAGVEDTDAVNLQQLRETLGAHRDPVTGRLVQADGRTLADRLGVLQVDGDAPATLDAASSRAVALGSGAQVTQGAQAAALGAQAQARGSRAVALGASARARGDAAQALGAQAQVAGDYTVAVGPSARGGRVGTAADGTQDRKANYAVAMGFNAGVEASGAVAIGSEARSAAGRGVSLGAYSGTEAGEGVALGARAQVVGAGSVGAVALGAGAQATRAQTVSIGNARQQRQLVHLAAGVEDTDAVNLQQLRETLGAHRDPVTGRLVQADGRTLADRLAMLQVDGDAPATLDAASSRAVALGSGAQVTQGAQAAALGAQAHARGSRAVALGASARARGDVAQALGAQAQVAGDYTVAVGPSARGGRLGAAADGSEDHRANYAVAMGFNAGVDASGAVAIGTEARSEAGRGVSLGAYSGTQAGEGVALGARAQVVGAGATGAVALGAGARATRADTVSIGNAREQRQLVNLAAGVEDTDAVNVQQVRDVLGADVDPLTGRLRLADGKTLSDALAGVGLVRGIGYDTAARDTLTLKAADGRGRVKLTGLQDGDLSGAASGDAVTGGQLFTVNQTLTQALDKVSRHAAAQVSALEHGAAGPVRLDGDGAAQQLTVGAALGGRQLNIAGVVDSTGDGSAAGRAGQAHAAGQADPAPMDRQLVGVAAGAGANHAANLAQLQQMLGDGAQIIDGTVKYVDGTTGLLSTVGARLSELDSRLRAGSGAIAEYRPSGADPVAVTKGSIALGHGSVANAANVVSVGNATRQRRIVNVGRPLDPHDAVNKDALEEGLSSVRLRAMQAISEVSREVAELGSRFAMADEAATGQGSEASGQAALALGARATVVGDGALALGAGARVGPSDVEVGDTGEAGAAGVTGATPTGPSVAHRWRAAQGASGLGGIREAVAIGAHAQASADRAVALGAGAWASAEDAVALGSGSLASRAMTVSMGAPGHERQVVNVAAGVDAHDAVNVQQVANVLGAHVEFGRDGAVTSFEFNGQRAGSLAEALRTGTADPADPAADRMREHVAEAAAQADGQPGAMGTEGQRGAPPRLATLDAQLQRQAGTLSAQAVALDGLTRGDTGLIRQDRVTQIVSIAPDTGGDTVDLSGTDGARRLTHVREGERDSDAATMGQLRAYAQDADGASHGLGLPSVKYVDDTLAMVRLGHGGGTVLDGVAAGTVAAGSRQAVNGEQLFRLSEAMKDVGLTVLAHEGRLAALDRAQRPGGTDVDLGSGTGHPAGAARESGTQWAGEAVGDHSVAFGAGSRVRREDGGAVRNGTALGVQAQVSADHGTAFGESARVSAEGGLALGHHAEATGARALASGEHAQAAGEDSLALGAHATASARNALALGANSVAERADTLSVGARGAERQITHVAAGVQGTDAVNLDQLNSSVAQGVQQANGYTDQRIGGVQSQLNELAKNAYAGIAATTALTMIPDVDAGRALAVGIGAANFKGYQAVALGGSARIRENVKLKAGAGWGSGGTTVGVGAAYQW
ncbi:hypothetical protein C7H84_35755 [Burkholderia sp. Nafp2/4-1b]|nr:hypothetical protein C7H84_35755 [Burkholderia sp. Nafp2/4-1b]